MSIFEFQEKFPDEDSYKKYLAEMKWVNSFICKKCSYTKYRNGARKFARKCNKCSHEESSTAGTLFHKVKFSLLKAFHIIYFISTNKKGIAN